MKATSINQQDLVGLFELDVNGRVLYSRVEYKGPKSELLGNNFFDVVGTFDIEDQIRSKITSFASSSKVADSFSATFKGESGHLPIRVLLARIRDRCRADGTESVLVHIKTIGKEPWKL